MSSTTASSTRSSSPASSDSLSDGQPASFQPVDFSAWLHPFSPDAESAPWSSLDHPADVKFDDNTLLMLDDLANDCAFEPTSPESPVAINPAVFQISRPPPPANSKPALTTNIFANFPSDEFPSDPVVPEIMARSAPGSSPVTQVVPPPPVQLRKLDHSTGAHRVIFPAKESCYDLAILTPNIPPSGTKSRVETQVRVSIDLAVASGPSFDPCYDRVGSWKWLKLPPGTATRKRSRKEGKIDASPVDTLHLEAEVTCSSNPTKLVTSCSTCQGREAKRVARKIAARIRPARSDSDNEGPSSRDSDASFSIIQFNCPDTLDFSSGSVVLPLRITCYCRHHREKVGFNVHFRMKDQHGRVVGKGMSPPIMITDDHKSTGVNAPKSSQSSFDVDWDPRASMFSTTSAESNADHASSRRRSSLKESNVPLRKRSKPYEAPRSSMMTRSRRSDTTEGNVYPTVISATTTSTTGNPYPDTSSISPFTSAPPSTYSSTAPPSPHPSDCENGSSSLPSPPDSSRYLSPINTTRQSPTFVDNADAIMEEAAAATVSAMSSNFFPLSPPMTAPSSPPMQDFIPQVLQSPNVDLSPFSYSLMQPQPIDTSLPPLPPPKVHRLIPSSGPTFGGIEVTVLGSNFDQSVLYNCVFGDVPSSSTTRWSENTLVCVLPPRATAGVVPVTLEGFKAEEENPAEPVLFTYTDESDRSLMELALQVVGLKMTGKIEDAKDIAMRIVGSSSTESTQQNQHMAVSQMVNLATCSAGATESRRILLSRTDDAGFEKLIMDSLSALDCNTDNSVTSSVATIISHRNRTGQTMLHLAAFLNFPSLVEFLIQREIDLDVQDNSGCTALHFAALSRSQCCARLLVNAGADTLVTDKIGRTPLELTPSGLFESVMTRPLLYTENGGESDEESQWGDVEEDSGDDGSVPVRSANHQRMLSKRRHRLPRSRLSSRVASAVQSDVSDIDVDAQPDAADVEDVESDDGATVVSPEADGAPGVAADEDEKPRASFDEEKRAAAASFAEYIQRAWAQFQPGQRMPQMLHMPQLPGVPAWVYPIYVPMPAWRPPFRIEKRKKVTSDVGSKGLDGTEVVEEIGEVEVAASGQKVRPPTSVRKDSTDDEWRTSWEKWTTQMKAAMGAQGQLAGAASAPGAGGVDRPPFEGRGESSLPRDDVPAAMVAAMQAAPASTHGSSRSLLRRFGYGRAQMAEIDASTSSHRRKRVTRLVKKEDRMLVFFWIPILILAVAWALYTAYPVILKLLQQFSPLKEGILRLTAQ